MRFFPNIQATWFKTTLKKKNLPTWVKNYPKSCVICHVSEMNFLRSELEQNKDHFFQLVFPADLENVKKCIKNLFFDL